MKVSYGFDTEPKGRTPSLVTQVHGATLVEVTDGHAPGSAPEADGVVTRAPGVAVHVFTADCLPLLLFDAAGDTVAAVHCGWRGALAGIASAAVRRVGTRGELHAVVGPCLRGCCMEVKDDFVRAWRDAHRPIDEFLEARGGRTFFHLDRYVIRHELAAIPPERLHTEALRCTFCSRPELPSFRRNKGTDPRIRAWIARA